MMIKCGHNNQPELYSLSDSDNEDIFDKLDSNPWLFETIIREGVVYVRMQHKHIGVTKELKITPEWHNIFSMIREMVEDNVNDVDMLKITTY